MRQVGTIASKHDADRFVDYLLTLGISSKAEPAADQWAVWIHDENQVPRSREELDQFQREPQGDRYRSAEQAAKVARKEAAEKRRQLQRNYVDMRNEWASPWRRRPVTLAMIAVSVALAFNLFGLPRGELMFNWPRIQQGDVWRLVTPIFLHAENNILHLIFNMFWLFDLGTLIERRLGSLRYVGLVLVIALASNFGQFIYVGPNFLGMSGVVYGLFGYAWVRGRLEPTSGLYLRQQVVVLMMAWLVMCMLIEELHAANSAHLVGLVAGAVLGYLPFAIQRITGGKNT